MHQLPTAYVSTLHSRRPKSARDGLWTETLDELAGLVAEADVRSPAASSLMRGRLFADDLVHSALFVLGDSRLTTIADWAGALSSSTYASILAMACADIGQENHLSRNDVALLTGHGMVIASRGVSGRPLVGLSLHELRDELEQSRRRLSSFAGYQARILVPTPPALGSAVDGLVLEEARRAGYKLVLHPGRSVTEFGDGRADLQTLNYRIVRTDDSAAHLRDWIVGKGFARPIAQVRELVNRPRRILSRLGLR